MTNEHQELIRYLSAPGGEPPDTSGVSNVERLEQIRELNEKLFAEYTTWGGYDIDTPRFCRRCILNGHYHQMKRILDE